MFSSPLPSTQLTVPQSPTSLQNDIVDQIYDNTKITGDSDKKCSKNINRSRKSNNPESEFGFFTESRTIHITFSLESRNRTSFDDRRCRYNCCQFSVFVPFFKKDAKMKVMPFAAVLSCVILIFPLMNIANGQVVAETSVEPLPDPINKKPSSPSQHELYLVIAGRAPHTETPIPPSSTLEICPSDYPTGFSIRCMAGKTRVVYWRVDGKPFKREYQPPYYLSGNWRDRVRPYNRLDGMTKGSSMRVSCRKMKGQNVWVNLVKSC